MPSDTSASTTPMVTLSVSPDPGFPLKLDRLEGTERLGRPFTYRLFLSSTKAKPNLTSVLGSSVTVTLTNPDKSKRYFNGIVGRIAYAGMRAGGRTYVMELRPWIWLLSHRKDCRIFQNQTVYDIITTVCKDAGFTDIEDNRKGSPKAGSQSLEYCVQYDETSMDFITRLMEEYGIYYYYQHADGKHTIVFADDPSSHDSIGAALPFALRQTGSRAVQDHLWQWSSELSVQSGKVTYSDYNFETSTVPLGTSSGAGPAAYKYGDFELFDFPGRYLAVSDGTPLTDVRLQGLAWQELVKFGTSNSRKLTTGSKFSMSGFFDDAENTSYVVIEASYELNLSEAKASSAGETRHVFTVRFQALADTTTFRLPRVTPRPRIHGAQTARVVTTPTGAATDEIVTDKYGRILVLFPWARPGSPSTQTETQQNAQKASCWIRVAQLWAGVSWGAMFIPRVGMEVVVTFLEGDPDRPLVVGCVYNDKQTVPYGLPADKTKSTIKSNSSEGGGGFNELRFEDKKNSEEVYFHAQKDYNKEVLNNETVTITQNTTTTVQKGNRSVTVSEGNNSHTVSKGNNSTTVSQGNESLTVSQGTSTTKVYGDTTLKVESGDHKTTVDQGDSSLTVTLGDHKIEATAGSSTYKTGASITIDAGDSITIKAANQITIQVGSSSITISSDSISISTTNFSVSGQKSVSLAAGASSQSMSSSSIALTSPAISLN